MADMNRRSTYWWALLGAGALAVLLGAVWVMALDRQVVRGFEAHLRRQPTVVYGSRLTLRRDQMVARAELEERLERLEFREADPPSRPGEYLWLDEETLQLILRPQKDLLAGGSTLPEGSPVVLRFDGERLAALTAPSLEGGQGEAAMPSAVLIGAEPLGVIAGENRLSMVPVKLEQAPPTLLAAVLTVEDRRFWRHRGVDPRAIGRAAVVNLQAGRIVEGGSTITQQLVKNLFLGHEQTVRRKAREAVMALLLEAHYPKAVILEAYLNSIYFGARTNAFGGSAQAVIGVGEAADVYFGRPVTQLSVAEQALLVAMIKSPVRYAPGLFQTTGNAKARRDLVLRRLATAGVISPEISEAAQATPVAAAHPPTLMPGGAPYVVDWTQQLLARRSADEGVLTPMTPGRQVITTIDPFLQRAAEAAVRNGLRLLEQGRSRATAAPSSGAAAGQEPIQAALIALDPRTGAIKALVGGRDYQESQFNRVVQARRQPGSLFKPVVYLAALERAPDGSPPFTLASIIPDEPITLQAGGEPWTPQNVDLVYRGPVTFRQVAESSLNAATVRIASTVGFERVVRMAQWTGASDTLLPALPSVALGAIEASPLEMATFYTTLAAGGRRIGPNIIDLVVEPDGGPTTFWSLAPPMAVVSPEAAYLVTSLLSGVIDRGTGRLVRAMGFDRPAAGKTGTSSNLHDAWFAGYTPELVALVWVGYDRPQPLGLTGAQAALPIWTRFMQAALEPLPPSEFEPPEGVVNHRIDSATGTLATWRCPDSVPEWFLAGTEPVDECRAESTGGVVRGWMSRAMRWFTN